MDDFLRGLHNLLRWLVLLGGLAALVTMLRGMFSSVEWSDAARRTGSVFAGLLDLQIVVGLILYVVSPLTRSAFGNMGAAMSNSDLRFFLVEHLVIMVLAAVAAHVGLAVARRAPTDRARYTRAGIGVIVALILIFLGIPWERPLIPWA